MKYRELEKTGMKVPVFKFWCILSGRSISFCTRRGCYSSRIYSH